MISRQGDLEPFQEALAARIRKVPDYPKPGIVFQDITPVLADPSLFAELVRQLGRPWDGSGAGSGAGSGPDQAGPVDKIVGIEARGFIVAAPLALAFGVGFVPVRKPGKLPAETYAESYALEYGEETLEMHQDAVQPGDRVLIVDDVLATGGTVEATSRLIRHAGADIAGVTVVLELTALAARARLAVLGAPLGVHTLLSV